MVAGSATFAAAALPLTCALLTLLLRISALSSDQLLVIGPDYIYKYNTTGWGWIHIVLATLFAVVAFGLLWGTTWARVILIAALSIVVIFLWLPYYPVWSIVVIALDVVVIWAVATWDTWRPLPCRFIAWRYPYAVTHIHWRLRR